MSETPTNPPTCTYDLSNLACFSTAPLSPPPAPSLESSLLQSSSLALKSLILNLYALPTKDSDLGPLHVLPTYTSPSAAPGDSKVALPRSKPPPKPKEPSKWEQFRLERGMESRKRGRKDFDEATGEWKVRYFSAARRRLPVRLCKQATTDVISRPPQRDSLLLILGSAPNATPTLFGARPEPPMKRTTRDRDIPSC